MIVFFTTNLDIFISGYCSSQIKKGPREKTKMHKGREAKDEQGGAIHGGEDDGGS
jgi:hypothetical protein